METAVIVDALRTPIGRYGGALKDIRPDDLAALAIKALLARTGIEPSGIEDVIRGCANQAGEDNRNVARMALLLAGLPVSCGGLTVNRLCGSGLDAVNRCAHAVQVGAGNVFIGGGVESIRCAKRPKRGTEAGSFSQDIISDPTSSAPPGTRVRGPPTPHRYEARAAATPGNRPRR